MKDLLNDVQVQVDREDYVYWDWETAKKMDKETFGNTPYESLLKEIPNLDVVVITKPVKFALNYPFENNYYGSIESREITLRMLIDAIRNGFTEMYKGADIKPIAGLINMDVRSPKYGEAMHVIGDLVIEVLEYDEAYNSLRIGMGS